MMDIDAEVKDIKQHIVQISERIDRLLREQETVSMMKLAEKSLSAFAESEPDIYGVEDLRVRYK